MSHKVRFLFSVGVLLLAAAVSGNVAFAKDPVVPSDSSVVRPEGAPVAYQDNQVIGSGYFTTTTIPATNYGSAGTYSLPVDKPCPAESTPAAAVYVESSGGLTPLTYIYKGKHYSVGNCAAGRICLAATVDPSTYKLNLYGLASQSDVGGHSTSGRFTASVFMKKSHGFQDLYMRPILEENVCDWAADNSVDRSITVGYKIYCKSDNAATQGQKSEVNIPGQRCDNTNEYEGGY